MGKFTKQYFIDKFSAIPDELWITGNFRDKKGRCCAIGHCSIEGEGLALVDIFGVGSSSCINDGGDPRFQQPTPRARILAALEMVEE